MKICFFTLPLFGHNNYGLKIASKLTGRNHEIHFYTGKKYEKLVTVSGICFKAYSDEVERLFSGSAYNSSLKRNVESKVDYYSELYLLALHLFSITDIVINVDIDRIRAEKYDAIFFDNIAIWGGKVGKILNIPTFASGTPYVYSKETIDKYPLEFADKLLRDKKVSGRSVKRFLNMCNELLWNKFPKLKDLSVTTNYSGSGDLNFIYTSTEFQLHPELLDEKKNLFIGIIKEDNDFPNCMELFDYKRKNVFVSLGTVFNNIAVYNLCIQSLKKLNYNVIISIGTANSENDFEEMPKEWHVGARFPQLQILRNIDLFITHGGTNSAREAVYYGVPMVVFPQSSDQFLAGIDIERNGLGVVFEKSISVEELTDAIEKIIENKEIKKRCDALSKKMQNLGGIDQVVEVIENKVMEGKMHSLERLLLISFEIGINCNLQKEHLECPINKIVRHQNAPNLTVETVCKAMDEANELGFKGHFAFHHYNEPLVCIDIIDKIINLRPKNKYLLWSNGLLVPDIEKRGYSLNIFDKIILTLYNDKDREMLTDVQKRYKNVKIYLAEMDERSEIYDSDYENIVSCKKTFIELPIDYYGEVCLCTHDWKNTHKLGNILETSMKDVVLGERYQKVLDGASKRGINENSPKICRKCKYAHLLETPKYAKVRQEN